MSEISEYKLYRQIEERNKRRNPYNFYDKDELIDTILENEDEIERLNNIINGIEKWLKEEYEGTIFDYHNAIEDVLNKLQELKGDGSNEKTNS